MNLAATTISVHNYTLALAYTAGGLIEYQGEAIPGSAKNEAKWRIVKYVYSDNNVTDIQFANGSVAFDKIWDDRTNYTYS